jgi:hypothetical protein
VRTDNTATGLEFNISDSVTNNDDFVTGQNNGNGLTNGVPKFVAAAQVTPNATLNAQYPNYPLEWRFNYVSVPSNGTATITVRLREATTAILPGRIGVLTRTINTFAPSQVLNVVSPPTEGAILVLDTNDVFTVQACYSASLTPNNIDLFSIFINGAFQPRRDGDGTPLYYISPSGCGSGQRLLYYDWAGAVPGTNTIQVLYTNNLILSDTRHVAVVRPGDSDHDGMPDYDEFIAGTNPFDATSVLRITDLANGNQLVVWDSVPGINYEVQATTNLGGPFLPLGPAVPAIGTSSFYFDPTPDLTNKFYRIRVAP